jgi:outer membrane protein assembly factor BamA
MDVTPPVAPEGDDAEWVLLPVPDSNPTIGTGLRLMAARFFRTDPVSQPSVLGAAAGYYTSDTWFAGAGGLLNLDEGRWQVTAGAGYFDANYDFYGIGSEAGGDGVAFPLRQSGTAAIVKVLRSVGAGWYLGAGYRYLDSNAGLRTSATGFPEIEQIVQDGANIVSSGPTLHASYDTRDLNTNPRSGSYIQIDAIFPTKSVGSDVAYQRVQLRANHYRPLSESLTLAVRLSLCGASDGAPFFDLCLFGASNDLRGYATGRYQDRSMAAVQAELRKQFTPRWGGVVFAGVGEVAPSFGDMSGDDLLPAGGFGVRFMAAPDNRVNVSADIAWGKDGDTAFYLYVGEAF